jgi:hypothetical protein
MDKANFRTWFVDQKGTLMKKQPAQLVLGIVILIISSQTVNGQWKQVDVELGASVKALAVGGGNIYAGLYGLGVFLSTDNGTTWTAVNSGLSSKYVMSLIVSGANIFTGIENGGVFLSTNDGTSWTPANSGLSTTNVGSFAVSDIGDIFAATGSGVFLSSNNGTTWTAIDSGLKNKNVLSLVVSSTGVIFAGTSTGIFRSTNNGTSGWTAINNSLPMNSEVFSLAVSGTGGVFAGTMFGIYRSTDSGTNWTDVNSGMGATEVYSLAVSGTGTIFAGTRADGVFLSANNGTTWTAISSGLPANSCIQSLVVSGDYIFAGTRNSSVWRRPLSEMEGVINPERKQKMISRENLTISSSGRANPRAIIEFSLPHFDQATVKIHDLSGHAIATLVDKTLESGLHSLIWDTRNIAAGCYFVRMQAGAMSVVKSVPLFR